MLSAGTDGCCPHRRQKRLKSFVTALSRTNIPYRCVRWGPTAIGWKNWVLWKAELTALQLKLRRAANSAAEPASLAESSTYESAEGHIVLSMAPSWGKQDVCRLIGLVRGTLLWLEGLQTQRRRQLMHDDDAWSFWLEILLQTNLCTPFALTKDHTDTPVGHKRLRPSLG